MVDAVRTLHDRETTFSVDKESQNFLINSGASSFELRLLRAEEFPEPPTPPAQREVFVPARTLSHAIDQVVRAVAHDDTRAVLSGVLVSGQAQVLRLVATDAYRLSIHELCLKRKILESFDVCVPARTLQEVSHLIAHMDTEEVSLEVREKQVAIRVAGCVLSSRLVTGRFPDYRQLLPEASEHDIRLATSEFRDTVRRISVVAQKGVPLRLGLHEGEVIVSAKAPNVGSARETLPAHFHGKDFEIGFNPEYLRDGLEGISSSELTLKLISPLKPGIIEADNGSLIYLLMPVRLFSTMEELSENPSGAALSGEG
jgi:DNA polymerase-3 subunit beta